MKRANKRRRKGRVSETLIQTLVELVAILKHGIIEELDKIAVIIQILIPVVIANTSLSIPGMIVVSCLLVMVTKYIKEVGYKLNHVTDRGFPIPIRRFTDKDNEGFVDIKEEDTQEAVLYLCEVEDYLKSKGLL